MKILVTGANGYIASHLIPILLTHGHHIIAVVRDKARFTIEEKLSGEIEVYERDLTKDNSTKHLPKDIDAAYYLVHSLATNSNEFRKKDKKAAEHFVQYLEKTTCKQVIYLSGLISDTKLSSHLQSRLEVENIIKQARCPHTILRAGIIIGSGSASFEIIRDLVEKLPVMVAPKWVSKKCQPIAIRDVIFYLNGVLIHEQCKNRTFDIGGPDQLSYREMLLEMARERHLKRLIIPIPILTPKLSSLWLYFITSANYQIARNLVDSMKNNAVCHEKSIQAILPRKCLTYKEAIEKAFARIEECNVISSWKDSFSFSNLSPHLSEFVKVPSHGCFVDSKTFPFECEKEKVFASVLGIGGKEGYYMNWAWRLRGFIDKLIGGVGLSRGKTAKARLHVGDVVDFWRAVLIDEEHYRLLLFAEMKLPGEAWLEFKIKNNTLIQTATFRPKGILGRIYWYGLYPFHRLIFDGMGARLIEKACK